MDSVRMTLPCFLPGEQRNWREVHAVATITESGEIHIKLRDPKDAEILVEMARMGSLFQVAFDYKASPELLKMLTEPREN